MIYYYSFLFEEISYYSELFLFLLNLDYLWTLPVHKGALISTLSSSIDEEMGHSHKPELVTLTWFHHPE